VARKRFFFAREPEAPQGSAHGPRIDPHPDLLGQAIAVFGQGQMIVDRHQTTQRRLAVVADRRPRAAAYRLGLKPAFTLGRLDPAIDGRAADREPHGHSLT